MNASPRISIPMDNNFSVLCPEIMGNHHQQFFGSMKIHGNPVFFTGRCEPRRRQTKWDQRSKSQGGVGGGGETRLSETAWTWFWLFIILRVGKKLLSHLIAYWAPLNNHQKESGNTCGRNNNLLSYYVLDVMVQHRFSANKINSKAREKKATVVWEWINDQQGKCFDLKTNLLTTNSWRKGREVSLCICISGIGGVRRMT